MLEARTVPHGLDLEAWWGLISAVVSETQMANVQDDNPEVKQKSGGVKGPGGGRKIRMLGN